MSLGQQIKPHQRIIGIPIVPLLGLAKYVCDQNDVRYYVNSVYIDPDGYLVATNGVMMATIRFQTPRPAPSKGKGGHGILVSAHSLAQFNKAYPARVRERESHYLLDIEETWNSADEGITVFRSVLGTTASEVIHTAKAVGGRYITWRHAMTQPTSSHTGLPAQLSPRHLLALDNLVRYLRGSKEEDIPQIEVVHAGPNRAAHIISAETLDWEFRAIVMPYGSKRIDGSENPYLQSLAERLKHFDDAEFSISSLNYALDRICHAKTAEDIASSIDFARRNSVWIQERLQALRQDLMANARVDLRQAA